VVVESEIGGKVAVKVSKSMLFRACVYPSPDAKGLLVAHCLELDLIGEGVTLQDAVVELKRAIELQIEACKSLSQLFFPAPASVWQKYKQARNAGRIVKQSVDQDPKATPGVAYMPHFESVVATSAVPAKYVMAV
jgi:hypothetical protein